MTVTVHPRDWNREVMSAGGQTCNVCGWREAVDNGPDLHEEHLAHILEMQESTQPFSRAHLSQAMQWPAHPPTKLAPGEQLTVWLAKDPQTCRILAQTREPSDDDLPRGARGMGWEWRRQVVDAQDYHKSLRAETTPTEQDRTHRDWWTQAAPEGVGPWPE